MLLQTTVPWVYIIVRHKSECVRVACACLHACACARVCVCLHMCVSCACARVCVCAYVHAFFVCTYLQLLDGRLPRCGRLVWAESCKGKEAAILGG